MPKFTKNHSGNPRGRPTNEARNKSLEELLADATAHLELKDARGREVSPQEARIRMLYQALFTGDVYAARQIIKLCRETLPKSRSHFEPAPDGVFVEFELTQIEIDQLHAEGYFPEGTPKNLEDIDEQVLTDAIRARRRDRIPD